MGGSVTYRYRYHELGFAVDAGQFQPTKLALTVGGKPMQIYQHRARQDESLTLGANAEAASVKDCNVYVVFVSSLKN